MGRPKESAEGDNVATSNWKLLLYPDNEQHVAVLGRIQDFYPDSFIYCEHRNYNDLGEVITEGPGKKHIHVGLISDPHKAIRRGSLCKRLGLMDQESGLPDFRFCRPVYGYFYKFLPYLTHRNSPDKEQYLDSELVGAPAMIALYRRGAIECESQALEVRECVSACLSWIFAHDQRVTYRDFAKWLIGTPYFRARNDGLVLRCLEEHNAKIAQREFEMVQQSSEAYQEQLRMVSGGRQIWLGDCLYSENDFEEVIFDNGSTDKNSSFL